MKSFKQFIVEADQTKSRPFKKWFNGSKIVDASGRPLVVFHGTDKEFTVFDTKSGHDRKTKQQLDFGSHFSVDDDYSKGYSKKGNNASYYLSIKNPLDLTDAFRWKGEPQFEELFSIFKTLKLKEFPDMYRGFDGEKHPDIQCVCVNMHQLNIPSPAKARNAVIGAGYDGIIYEPFQLHGIGSGMRLSNHPKAFIAFYPTQIKSAINNNGNFDPSDPDITH